MIHWRSPLEGKGTDRSSVRAKGIPNPFALIWWPFGQALKIIGGLLVRSDRFWAWYKGFMRDLANSTGMDPDEYLNALDRKRTAWMLGASAPGRPVEKSEAEKPGEAK